MLDTIHILFLAVLSVWWLISLISNWKYEKMKKFRSKDIFHLIPNYRFFAPVPAKKDYHLEYRIQTKASEYSKWKRIEFLSSRNFLSTFWYPDKRLRKSFNTSVRRITKMLSEYDYETTARSNSYLHLLNYLQNRNTAKNSKALQFRIVSQQDFAYNSKPKLVFTSDWHKQNM